MARGRRLARADDPDSARANPNTGKKAKAVQTSSQFRFEEPPRATSGGHMHPRSDRHLEIAAALKARAGEWGVVDASETGSPAYSMSNAIRTGRLVAYRPKGAFDSITRRVGAEYRVYARYVGETEGGAR